MEDTGGDGTGDGGGQGVLEVGQLVAHLGLAGGDALLDAAAGFGMVKIQVSCSLETLLKRERERGNRFAGSAEASLKYLYPKEGYDLRIDSGTTNAASSAAKIMDFLLSPPAV